VLDTLSASVAGGEVGGLVLREAVHVRFPRMLLEDDEDEKANRKSRHKKNWRMKRRTPEAEDEGFVRGLR
jgi:hypothetical protein